MRTAIDQLRAALLADEEAQRAIAPLADTDAFLNAITAYAAGLNLPLTRQIFAAGLTRDARPDAQRHPPALRLMQAPPAEWLPAATLQHNGALVVEWLHFAGQPLTDPFFDETERRVRALPFNALMRCATPLSALDAFADAAPPDGLVFHMSRCGSTLIGQMLGAVPAHIVIAESPALDVVIRLANMGFVAPDTIRAMAGALTRERTGGVRHRFIKLDSWHAWVLPLLRGVWPDVPWVFLYRDPIEVLVSQRRKPGMQAIPGALPLAAYGIDPAASAAAPDYIAWVLDRICSDALAAVDDTCLLLNYAQLPAAVADAILPHFGVVPDEAALARIAAAGGRYSKAPGLAFTPDTQAKQAEAGTELRAAAAPLLSTYRALEARRIVASR